MLTQAPVLDILKTSTLETDVSGTGLEVVLAQSRKMASWDLIVFASRTLQLYKKNYAELEALALVWAVKHFCVYL